MKKAAVILLAFILAVPTFAQGKFGADSAECIKYLSYYSELMKQNNIQEATPFWRQAISLCPPTANQNLLINGTKILRNEINQNRRNPERYKELVDSLLMLHDVRAEYYPKYYNSTLNNKAIDVINYCKFDKKLSYETLSKIVNDIKSACSPVVYVNYMQVASDLYKEGTISPDDVMQTYTNLADYMDTNTNPDIASAKAAVEQILIDSGVASCENLVELYTPRYEAGSTDKNLLSGMVKMLTKSECYDSDLYLKAVESLNAVDPSRESAYFLYKLYSSKDRNDEAADALSKAISMIDTNDPANKGILGDYTLELATFYFKKCGKNAAAVNVAKTIPEINPALTGKAYLLIGTIWGSQKCYGNEVESRAPFWVAVDYMIKAKNADPSLADEADGLAAQYRRYFPQQAEAFMYDVTDGSSYRVNCGGLSELTTVRTNK
ncbi:MAG: hypothetical protein IJT26_02140 [Bacteroidales bacterium]|nr:hypothetical protein [Bacteroidales bacterium]